MKLFNNFNVLFYKNFISDKFINTVLLNKYNKINIGDILSIKYFFFYKKKRKVFRFYGLCINKKSNFFLDVRLLFHNTKLKLNFFFFNPYIFELEKISFYDRKYNIKRLYFKSKFLFKNFLILNRLNYFKVYNFIFFENFFIYFLVSSLCSQYKSKKFIFLYKTRYKFR